LVRRLSGLISSLKTQPSSVFREEITREIYENEFSAFVTFMGITHLRFKRSMLIEKMNDIIAKHYPDMLPAK
jgi:hypothetical protein